MAKTTKTQLRGVTERVVDQFTFSAMLFTALDVSNAVKTTLADVRHRDVSPIVREIFEREGMGTYKQTLIDVMAEGSKPAQAYLYHLPSVSPKKYDDRMRSKLAIPPVSSSAKEDDDSVTDDTKEMTLVVGKDGRVRISRHLLRNAGVTGDEVKVVLHPRPVMLELISAKSDGGELLSTEHPEVFHLPSALVAHFGAKPDLLARIEGKSVWVKQLN